MITKDGIKLCSLVIHHQAISEINRACVLLFSSCVSIRNSTAALLFLEKETTEGTTGKKNKTKQQTAQRQTEPPQSWTVHGEDADASPAIYLTGTHNWKVCTGTNHWPSVLNHRTIVWPKPQSELYCQQPSWRNKKKTRKSMRPTPLRNYKAFWAVNCSVWNPASRSDSFSVDINDGIPSEVALPRTTFVVFELSAVEVGWVKSWWTTQSWWTVFDLCEQEGRGRKWFWPLSLNFSLIHACTHYGALLSQDKINAFIAFCKTECYN